MLINPYVLWVTYFLPLLVKGPVKALGTSASLVCTRPLFNLQHRESGEEREEVQKEEMYI